MSKKPILRWLVIVAAVPVGGFIGFMCGGYLGCVILLFSTSNDIYLVVSTAMLGMVLGAVALPICLWFFFRQRSRGLTMMKYRAVCPRCGKKFPRSFYYRWRQYRGQCSSCGCKYRVNWLWELIGDGVHACALATFALSALLGLMSWWMAAALILAVFIIGYILFPYLTPYTQVRASKTHDGTSDVEQRMLK